MTLPNFFNSSSVSQYCLDESIYNNRYYNEIRSDIYIVRQLTKEFRSNSISTTKNHFASVLVIFGFQLQQSSSNPFDGQLPRKTTLRLVSYSSITFSFAYFSYFSPYSTSSPHKQLEIRQTIRQESPGRQNITILNANSQSSEDQPFRLKDREISISTQINNGGPISFNAKAKIAVNRNMIWKKQQKMQQNVQQHPLSYFTGLSWALNPHVINGKMIIYRPKNTRYEYTIIWMKVLLERNDAGIKRECSSCIVHRYTNPSPPKLKPLIISPRNTIRNIFQESVRLIPDEPIRQMKIKIDSIGQKQARAMIPKRIFQQQGCSSLIIKQAIIQAERARMTRIVSMQAMGSAGYILVPFMVHYYFQRDLRRLMQRDGASVIYVMQFCIIKLYQFLCYRQSSNIEYRNIGSDFQKTSSSFYKYYYILIMNILRCSVNRFAVPLSRVFMGIPNRTMFSEYFKQKDTYDLNEYEQRSVRNKKYRALIDLWKRPLQKKRLRQARIKQIQTNLPQPQAQIEKFIVHNPVLGIKSPPQAQNVFAVVKIDQRQYKVTNDCVVLLDTKEDHQIGKDIVFQEVLLVGTNTYTLLGRPLVTSAKVQATIESISQSQKVIVFKKKRRKQYKRSFGSRVSLSSVRINNIVHKLSYSSLNKADWSIDFED